MVRDLERKQFGGLDLGRFQWFFAYFYAFLGFYDGNGFISGGLNLAPRQYAHANDYGKDNCGSGSASGYVLFKSWASIVQTGFSERGFSNWR